MKNQPKEFKALVSKASRMWLSIGVTIIVAVLIVGGAAYSWQRVILQNQTPISGNWKTYTNQPYGYQLQYPPNATIRETKEDAGLTNAPQSCMTIQYPGGGFIHLRASGARTRCAVEGSAESSAVIQQVLVIGGQQYQASGIMIRSNTDFNVDVLGLALDQNIQIEFGVIADKKVSPEEYSHIKDTVIKIVESYQPIK